MDIKDLTDIAIKAALSAGKIIQLHASNNMIVEKKMAGTSLASQVVTEIDFACEKIILSHLLPTCLEYDIALLSEETKDDGSRFVKDFFWCIDPMDGTLAFINNRPGFSVSIALIAKDGTPYIGVIYDPTKSVIYHAIRGEGAYKNGKKWIIENTNTHLSYVTDRLLKDTPQTDKLKSLLTQLTLKHNLSGVKEIDGAGAVLNAILVLENGPACMCKIPKKDSGGGSLWDFAATACIYHELGLPATNYYGQKLDLNRKKSTFMNHEGIYYANLKECENNALDD